MTETLFANRIPADAVLPDDLQWKEPVREILVYGNDFGLIMRYAVYKKSEKGKPTFAYDGILRLERGGAVFVPYFIRGGKLFIGVMKRQRFQLSDQDMIWVKNHYQDILKYHGVPEFYKRFGKGRVSWECPRGFGDANENALNTAIREAEEETGGVVTKIQRVCDINDNTAFSPHMTALVLGNVDMTKKPKDNPDGFEKLATTSGLEYKTITELYQLRNEGTLYCNFTLAGIADLLMRKARCLHE
jgi:ADP-ribose pyrophosphatase YjhB (NUDIX family)